MTQTLKHALKWLLCGGAFVAVVGSAGCSTHHQAAVTTEPPLALVDPYQSQQTPAPAPVPTGEKLFENPQQQQTEAKPPVINIFGEMDGQTNAPPKQIGEAGFQQHTYLDEGYDANVSVSPDGKWIVFASTRHSEHPDIYLQRVDGQSVTQLTADDADDAYPAFSPDGKQVAFSSTRNGSWDIFVMDVDGRNATQVTSGPAQDLHPSFSPDGKRIVYSSMGSRSGQWEIWTVNLVSNEKKMIGFGLFPSWSPDKTVDRIAFQRAVSAAAGGLACGRWI